MEDFKAIRTHELGKIRSLNIVMKGIDKLKNPVIIKVSDKEKSYDKKK